MEFFQYGNPRVLIRGFYDNVDFWNIVDNVFKPKGYKLIQSYNSLIFGLAAREYQSKRGHYFTFEYDDWGNMALYPDDPENNDLLNELHLLADEIELIGSNNPDNQDDQVSKRNYPERDRLFIPKNHIKT